MIKIDFLNVGHGDCTVVKFPSGRIAVIDINNGKIDSDSKSEIFSELGISEKDILLKRALNNNFDESKFLLEKGYDIDLTDPVDWLTLNKISSIFRFICTHPDMDHISGLHKLNESTISIENFWDIDHEFEQDSGDEGFTSGKYDFKDWEAYQELRKSTVSPKKINPLRNHSRDFWNQDGVYILAPDENLIKIAHDTDNKNHLSYVLLIVYGKTKIYLCGDATNDQTIPDMIKHYGEDAFKKQDGELVILKAPHHGRDSGFHNDFVKAIKPDVVICSVGKKPATDASNKYRNHSENVWSTRWKGNISLTCDSDGKGTYNFQYDR